MKPAAFAYSRPATLDEAIALLAADPAGARPMAGGQSLVPMLNLRLAPVDRIVDLGRIAELREVRDDGDRVRFGAATRHAQFEDRLVPDASNGLMAHVAARFAFRAVRTRGTIGGALALADAAADWVLAASALEAVLHVAGPDGRRTVPMDEFMLGPYYTALQEGELVVAVEFVRRPPSERWGWNKVTTKVGEYAESMAIALVDRSRDAARIVVGAVDGAPIVLHETASAVRAGVGADALARTVEKELLGAERDFTRARLHMHVTTAVRAIADATKEPR